MSHYLSGDDPMRPDVQIAIFLAEPSPRERCVRTTSPSSTVTCLPYSPSSMVRSPRSWISRAPLSPVNQIKRLAYNAADGFGENLRHLRRVKP